MPLQDQKLCESCQQRPTTYHICCGNTGETKNLCEQCFLESSSPDLLTSSSFIKDAIRKGKCRYCGEPSVGGCGGSVPFFGENLELSFKQNLDLWCEACRQDLVVFASGPENVIPEFPFDDEAAQERLSQQMAERERRQEEYMMQRVLERKPKEDG